jgi:nucleotide-binding universal stress UspA family protein
MSTRIMLAYDGTSTAQKAFDFILALPRDQRTDLAIVAVIKSSSFALDCGAQDMLDAASDELSSQLDQLDRRAQFAGCSVVTSLRLGHPAEQIALFASDWRADLIVVGQPARKRFLPSPWRTLSSEIRHRVQCDVHVVQEGRVEPINRVRLAQN